MLDMVTCHLRHMLQGCSPKLLWPARIRRTLCNAASDAASAVTCWAGCSWPAHATVDHAARCAPQAAGWDGQGAAGGRVDVMRAGSDDSPSKRNSALDLTGAAIIKSTPGEGARSAP